MDHYTCYIQQIKQEEMKYMCSDLFLYGMLYGPFIIVSMTSACVWVCVTETENWRAHKAPPLRATYRENGQDID